MIRSKFNKKFLLVILLVLIGIFFFNFSGAVNIDNCYTITAAGYYNLTANVVNNTPDNDICINIQTGDVIFTGNDFKIDGVAPGSKKGVEITTSGGNNITFQNVNLTNVYYGIYFDGGSTGAGNATIANNTFFGGVTFGVYLQTSNYSTIYNNTFRLVDTAGIYATGSCNNNISTNTIISVVNGLDLESNSNENTIEQNTLTSNNFSLIINNGNSNIIWKNTVINSTSAGFNITNSNYTVIFDNNLSESNNVGYGLTDAYYSNITLNIIDRVNSAGFRLRRSSHNIIHRNNITNVSYVGGGALGGYNLSFSDNNTLSNNEFRNEIIGGIVGGIRMGNSSNNNISFNTITNSSSIGFYLSGSNYNTIKNNIYVVPNDTMLSLGTMQLYSSNYNFISGINGQGGATATGVVQSTGEIYLSTSSHNIIEDANITFGGGAIYLTTNSNNNSFEKINIVSSMGAVWMISSDNNILRNSNFSLLQFIAPPIPHYLYTDSESDNNTGTNILFHILSEGNWIDEMNVSFKGSRLVLSLARQESIVKRKGHINQFIQAQQIYSIAGLPNTPSVNISYTAATLAKYGIRDEGYFRMMKNVSGTWSNMSSTGVDADANFVWSELSLVETWTSLVNIAPISFGGSDSPPSMILNAPKNLSINLVQTLNFNFTAWDDINETMNCSLFIDGVWNATNQTVYNNSLTNFQVVGVTNGAHNWSVNCSDYAPEYVNYNISDTWDFSVFTPTTECGILTESVALTTNVSSTGICFTIAAENVVLDCQGYKITYGTNGTTANYGIVSRDGNSGTTIRNCVVEEGNTGVVDRPAIYFIHAIGTNNLSSNEIRTVGAQSHGISLSNTSAGINSLNTIYSNGTNSYGIYILDSNSSTTSTNTIFSSGTGTSGIFVAGVSSTNNISFNNLTSCTIGLNFIGSNYTNIFLQNNFNGTEVSMLASQYFGKIEISKAVTWPDDPTVGGLSTFTNISKYINVTNTTVGTWVNLSIHYSDNDWLNGRIYNESNISILKYIDRSIPSEWESFPSHGVDTSANIVWTNMTTFSLYAAMGEQDTQSPIIVPVAPANGLTYATGSTWAKVNWTVEDDHNSSMQCSAVLTKDNSQTTYTNTTCLNATTSNYNITSLSAGTHYWNVTCSDGFNTNTSTMYVFTIDTSSSDPGTGGGGSGGGSTGACGDGFCNRSSALYNFECYTENYVTVESITLYANWTGEWGAVDRKTFSGGENVTANFTKTFATSGNYIWNCYVCGDSGRQGGVPPCLFTLENQTIEVTATGGSESSYNCCTDCGCGSYGIGYSCTPTGCVYGCTDSCGNDICESACNETISSCPDDCNLDLCGNGVCDLSKGENSNNCPDDCVVSCGNGVCEPEQGESSTNCPADCSSSGDQQGGDSQRKGGVFDGECIKIWFMCWYWWALIIFILGIGTTLFLILNSLEFLIWVIGRRIGRKYRIFHSKNKKLTEQKKKLKAFKINRGTNKIAKIGVLKVHRMIKRKQKRITALIKAKNLKLASKYQKKKELLLRMNSLFNHLMAVMRRPGTSAGTLGEEKIAQVELKTTLRAFRGKKPKKEKDKKKKDKHKHKR
ncbi:MAG: NosD domain-containing protein [archaeon]